MTPRVTPIGSAPNTESTRSRNISDSRYKGSQRAGRGTPFSGLPIPLTSPARAHKLSRQLRPAAWPVTTACARRSRAPAAASAAARGAQLAYASRPALSHGRFQPSPPPGVRSSRGCRLIVSDAGRVLPPRGHPLRRVPDLHCTQSHHGPMRRGERMRSSWRCASASCLRTRCGHWTCPVLLHQLANTARVRSAAMSRQCADAAGRRRLSSLYRGWPGVAHLVLLLCWSLCASQAGASQASHCRPSTPQPRNELTLRPCSRWPPATEQ